MSQTLDKEETKSRASDLASESEVCGVREESEVCEIENRPEVDDVKNDSTIRSMKNPAKGSDDNGRIVTDSVHERFRQPYVYCPQCKIQIAASKTEIESHFNESHVSDNSCVYCNGKVFQYVSFGTDDDGNEYSKHVTHHRCTTRE